MTTTNHQQQQQIMAANLSKDFFELIKAIGESKSKQEEDRIIQEEVRNLKAILADMKSTSTSKRMRELLVRLIYVEMLGHDASWGYVIAVQQTATTNLPQKRAGYLACSLMLHPDHDFRFMLVNQMQRDLGSANVLETCASLVAICKLVTLEMIPALLPRVAETLTSSEHTLVRKKAVMALHRFYQLDPASVKHLTGPVKALLRDRDPSVMASALCLLHEFAKQDAHSQLDLCDQYCSILKQITEHRLPREFDYHRMPAPWIQIKLLKIMATLAKGNKQASESMYEVLGECIKRADSGTNIGFAVAYECVKTIAAIWPCEWLLDLAANTISKFIQSDQYNLKFLGVTGLAWIVRTNPKYAVQHQMAVIDCLEDPDESLKRITLELLFRMTNAQNVEPVVQKLMHFLKQAKDPFLKRDLVDRIIQLADGFAPNSLWFVRTMIDLLNEDYVPQTAVHSLLKLIAEEEDEDVRSTACELFTGALHDPKSTEMMLTCAFWVLGEFAEDKAAMLEEMCTVLEQRPELEVSTRLYGVSALGKLLAHFPAIPARVQRVLESNHQGETQVEQRSLELVQLFRLQCNVKEILPEDASCEDFEGVEFGFLDEFCSILRTAGAVEYQPRLKITKDADYLDDFRPSNSPPMAQSGGGAGLRFDAYEAPKFEFQAPPPPPPPKPTSTLSFSGQQPQQAAAKPQVKNLWGPTGYTGNVPQQQQQVAAFSAAAKQQQQATYDFGGDYEDPDEDVVVAPRVAAAAKPKPAAAQRELTEKEKAAQALFGGMSVSSTKPATKPAKQQQAPAPQQQPVADLLSLDDVYSAPAAKPASDDLLSLIDTTTPPPPAPQPKNQVPIGDIMDLFSAPPPQQQPSPAMFKPPQSPPVMVKQEARALLMPKPGMTTPEFGALWGSHTAEVHFALQHRAVGGGFKDLLSVLATKLGCTLIEFIPATSEAILAGQFGAADNTVLLHAKDSQQQQTVDFIVKSKQPQITNQVVEEIKRKF